MRALTAMRLLFLGSAACGLGREEEERRRLHAKVWLRGTPTIQAMGASYFDAYKKNPAANIVFIHGRSVRGAVVQQVLARFCTDHQLLPVRPRHLMKPSDERRYSANILWLRASWHQVINAEPVRNPVLVTLLRDPYARAFTEYHKAHAMLTKAGSSSGSRSRNDDDTAGGAHGSYLLAFVKQRADDLARFPGLRISPQFTQFGVSVEEALNTLRSHRFLLGLTDKIEELLIMLRRRCGWDLKDVLFLDMRSEEQKRRDAFGHLHWLNEDLSGK